MSLTAGLLAADFTNKLTLQFSSRSRWQAEKHKGQQRVTSFHRSPCYTKRKRSLEALSPFLSRPSHFSPSSSVTTQQLEGCSPRKVPPERRDSTAPERGTCRVNRVRACVCSDTRTRSFLLFSQGFPDPSSAAVSSQCESPLRGPRLHAGEHEPKSIRSRKLWGETSLGQA